MKRGLRSIALPKSAVDSFNSHALHSATSQINEEIRKHHERGHLGGYVVLLNKAWFSSVYDALKSQGMTLKLPRGSAPQYISYMHASGVCTIYQSALNTESITVIPVEDFEERG